MMLITLLTLSLTGNLFAQEDEAVLDALLRKKIIAAFIKPMEQLPLNTNEAQLEIGRRLFMDPIVSGNKKVSCLSCHNPRLGAGDALPLSRNERGTGILNRNSPHLFNVGGATRNFMFWDGRVSFDPESKTFKTPEPAFNGANPERSDITSVMTSALSMQALFPMVASKEMMGVKGENEIADSKNNLEAWDKILERIKNDLPRDSRIDSYSELFKRAYPNQKINIGHVGESLAAFEREFFQSTESPFNNYLRGDMKALTLSQKKGFAVFIGKGKCINCHVGTELGSNGFFASVGVPTWGEAPLVLDKGRGDITLDGRKNYFFKTVSLLNISLTAPYMHNGAFETIRDVINHYSDINSSLYYYEIPKMRAQTMPVPLALANDSEHLSDLFVTIQAKFLREGLNFTPEEKDDLEAFLKEGLTDPRWKNVK